MCISKYILKDIFINIMRKTFLASCKMLILNVSLNTPLIMYASTAAGFYSYVYTLKVGETMQSWFNTEKFHSHLKFKKPNSFSDLNKKLFDASVGLRTQCCAVKHFALPSLGNMLM